MALIKDPILIKKIETVMAATHVSEYTVILALRYNSWDINSAIQYIEKESHIPKYEQKKPKVAFTKDQAYMLTYLRRQFNCSHLDALQALHTMKWNLFLATVFMANQLMKTNLDK